MAFIWKSFQNKNGDHSSGIHLGIHFGPRHGRHSSGNSSVNYCAKRSLRPSGSQNKMFRVSVRQSIRPFVRKVITFCEAYMRGSQVPENSGVLKTGFFRSWKKVVKVYISLANAISFGSTFGHLFWTLEKHVPDVDCVSWQKSWRFQKTRCCRQC